MIPGKNVDAVIRISSSLRSYSYRIPKAMESLERARHACYETIQHASPLQQITNFRKEPACQSRARTTGCHFPRKSTSNLHLSLECTFSRRTKRRCGNGRTKEMRSSFLPMQGAGGEQLLQHLL